MAAFTNGEAASVMTPLLLGIPTATLAAKSMSNVLFQKTLLIEATGCESALKWFSIPIASASKIQLMTGKIPLCPLTLRSYALEVLHPDVRLL